MACIARGNGGDAGGEPPQQPRRLPHHCEVNVVSQKIRRYGTLWKEIGGWCVLEIEFEQNNQITYTHHLGINNMFGSAWFHMILPSYMSALQLADVFGSGYALFEKLSMFTAAAFLKCLTHTKHMDIYRKLEMACIARGNGGDAGGEPPQQPRRLRHHCEDRRSILKTGSRIKCSAIKDLNLLLLDDKNT
nr:hypothetical protein [Tanacetum cinerariifolium]